MLGPSRPPLRRTVLAPFAVVLLGMVAAVPAHAASSPSPATSPGPAPESAGNQVVLLGRVDVPQGQSVGEVVVFSGRVVVEGIVRGDVVVVDGPITVSGQVSGSVVALDGSVRLLGTAQVGGDVLAHDGVTVSSGAVVQGRMREGVSFTISRPLRAVAAFVSWLAVALSTLLLGLLFVFLAPRGLDRIADAGRTAVWASAGWGIALALGVPALSVLAVASVLGLPLGIGLVLSIVLLSLFGVAVTAQVVGRAVVDRERHAVTAFLAGWGIETVVGVDPLRQRRGVRGRGDLRAGGDDRRRLADAGLARRPAPDRQASGGRGHRRRGRRADREP